MKTEPDNIKELESRLLLDAIYSCYGYDFRSYVLSGIVKRFEDQVSTDHLRSISDMIPLVLHDKDYFCRLLLNLSVTVTELFRDPFLYKELKEKVMPVMKTYPFINIWCAGCATGEEAYSIAILLEEENLLSRAQIYATDINAQSLEIARAGIYSLEKIRKYSENYNAAGGIKSLSNYYSTKYGACKMNKELSDRILFSKHNLVNDGIFAEMHLVFCRNVLIYFNDSLQHKVLDLFYKSLVRNGFLFMGENETINCKKKENLFESISDATSLYKKISDF